MFFSYKKDSYKKKENIFLKITFQINSSDKEQNIISRIKIFVKYTLTYGIMKPIQMFKGLFTLSGIDLAKKICVTVSSETVGAQCS